MLYDYKNFCKEYFSDWRVKDNVTIISNYINRQIRKSKENVVYDSKTALEPVCFINNADVIREVNKIVKNEQISVFEATKKLKSLVKDKNYLIKHINTSQEEKGE